MGWYKPHSTWNKPKEPGLTDKCIFCSHHKPIKRTDFVLSSRNMNELLGLFVLIVIWLMQDSFLFKGVGVDQAPSPRYY